MLVFSCTCSNIIVDTSLGCLNKTTLATRKYKNMDYNFEGRKILVTGSGRGVGRALASSLARTGAKVYALDCVKETLDELVKEIPSITAIHQDLKDWEQTREKYRSWLI